jgi:hypothetical protein
MKKQVILSILLVCSLTFTKAQLVSDLYKIYNPISQSTSSNDTTTIYSPFGIIKPGSPQYSVSFNTGYTSFGRGNGFASSSVTPIVAFAPTNKMQVVAGATISHNNMSNMPMVKNGLVNSNMQQTGSNPTQAFAYAQYNINNKISVYAMGSFSQNQPYISPFYSGIATYNSQEFGVGFNYKINSKVTIGGSFNYSNGPMFGTSPYGYSNMFNPFNTIIP